MGFWNCKSKVDRCTLLRFLRAEKGQPGCLRSGLASPFFFSRLSNLTLMKQRWHRLLPGGIKFGTFVFFSRSRSRSKVYWCLLVNLLICFRKINPLNGHLIQFLPWGMQKSRIYRNLRWKNKKLGLNIFLWMLYWKDWWFLPFSTTILEEGTTVKWELLRVQKANKKIREAIKRMEETEGVIGGNLFSSREVGWVYQYSTQYRFRDRFF